MPIALLLQESVLTIRFGAQQLTPWAHLAQIEELLIDRARGAFLVRWFGTHLPTHGLYLRVFIENLESFRARYLEAVASAKGEITGPNLTEPLAGAAGTIAGLIASPTGMVLLVAVSVRKMKSWVGTLLIVLTSIIGAPFVWSAEISAVVLGLGLPLGLIGGVAIGAVKEENTGAAIDLLGSAARLLDSARVLLEQMLGPREKVSNPLLRQFLTLLDKLAGLAPHLLAFLAIVITKLGPLLLPLVAQMNALTDLFATAWKTAKFLIDDLLNRFQMFIDPKARESALKVIGYVIEQLMFLLPDLIDTFTIFFDESHDTLLDIYHGMVGKTSKEPKEGPKDEPRSGFKGLFETMGEWLDAAFHAGPLSLVIEAAQKSFGAAGAAMGGPLVFHLSGIRVPIPGGSSSGKSSMPSFPTISITTPDDVTAALGGEPLLDFGMIEPLALVEDFLKKIFLGQPQPLSAEVEKQLDRYRHPPSLFEGERQALKKALGGIEPKDVLAKQVAGQQTLRELILAVVGRVMPPEIRPYLDEVGNAFAALDATLLFKKKGEKTEFPVRDIPDNGKLRPVVRRLIIRAAGGSQLDLQDFAARVAKSLDQDYPALVGATP